MSREHVALLSHSSNILFSYFQTKFLSAVQNDMFWIDEPDAMINVMIMELEAEAVCMEIAHIGLEIILENMM